MDVRSALSQTRL